MYSVVLRILGSWTTRDFDLWNMAGEKAYNESMKCRVGKGEDVAASLEP
jgi:hypothetical protein